MKPQQKRLDSVDALRGLAALYVLVYHLALLPQPNLTVPQWASPYVLTGGTGVTLFFIVSAFCLCLSMRLHKQEPHPTLLFYTRRFFRIAPLFYLWLIAAWFRDKALSGVTHSAGEIFLNVIFGFNFVPGKHEGFVWASWTLGVEMIFYLFFPLFFRYFNNWWKSLCFFALTLFIAAGYSSLVTSLPIAESHRASFLQFSFLNQLPIFSLGMVAFFIFEHFIQGKPHHNAWAFLLAGIAVLWYSAMVGVDPLGYSNLLPGRFKHFLYGYYLQGIIYGILLLGLTIVPLRLLVNRLTCFYGKISYSVYLNHTTLVFLLIPVYRKIYSLNLQPTMLYGTCLLLTVALLTLLSYGSYRFIEQPGMRLGKKLTKYIASQ